MKYYNSVFLRKKLDDLKPKHAKKKKKKKKHAVNN